MLGKAVHSLSRIGDELYLEPLEDGVRGWVWGGGWDSSRERVTRTRVSPPLGWMTAGRFVGSFSFLA